VAPEPLEDTRDTYFFNNEQWLNTIVDGISLARLELEQSSSTNAELCRQYFCEWLKATMLAFNRPGGGELDNERVMEQMLHFEEVLKVADDVDSRLNLLQQVQGALSVRTFALLVACSVVRLHIGVGC